MYYENMPWLSYINDPGINTPSPQTGNNKKGIIKLNKRKLIKGFIKIFIIMLVLSIIMGLIKGAFNKNDDYDYSYDEPGYGYSEYYEGYDDYDNEHHYDEYEYNSGTEDNDEYIEGWVTDERGEEYYSDRYYDSREAIPEYTQEYYQFNTGGIHTI